MRRCFAINTKISIVIPVLNESHIIELALERLQNYQQQGHEIIVVDGGSTDNTLQLASPLADKLLQTQPGRAIQMNAGANKAIGDVLLFLHIDTLFPDACFYKLQNLNIDKPQWGRFDVKLSNPRFIYKVIAFFINLRSRITHIATGDQCIFATKKIFEKVNGYPEIALMEDVAISKLLGKIAKPICFKETVLTSSRRWEKNGVIKTIIMMWFLRLAYFFKVSPKRLQALYEK